MEGAVSRARASYRVAAFALALGGCASGDVPGFSGGNASFGSGGPVDPSADSGDDDDGASGTPDDGAMTDGATSSDPTGASGPPDPDDSGSGSDGADSETGNPDGPACVPSEETCDGVDNDCDLEIDEDDPGGGLACSTGMPGPCDEGVTACEAGAEVCNQVGMASPEVCDGVDNDCSGAVDNGDPEGGRACTTGLPGICAQGTTACEGGSIACNQNQQAGTEQCNNADDDCDGTNDDGNPGGGGACNTGQPGICSAGTLTCQAGGLNCVQNQSAQGEVCGNGVDEDCDGTADDGCGCAHDVCVTGGALANGCSPCVSSICAVDSFCCNTSWDSLCVGEVDSVCGQVCQGTCSHSPCVTGVALVSGCVACVTEICGVDAFCCDTSWDGICVNEVASVCGLTC